MMPKEPELKDMLAPALRVLKSLGGQLVFADDDGDQFVLASKEAFENLAAKSEKQLSLSDAAYERHAEIESEPEDVYEPPVEVPPEEDAPPWHEEPQEAPTFDDLSLDIPASDTPMRVRFEPIKGDLPPELQE